jgi:hypothetical protein
VPPEREVGRELEHRAPDRPAVDGPRLGVQVDLGELADARVPLELDPHLDRQAVGHVDRELDRPPLADDDRGREHPSPRRVRGARDRDVDALRCRRVDPHRPEHGDERVGCDILLLTVESPVVRRDAIGTCEVDERGRGGWVFDGVHV